MAPISARWQYPPPLNGSIFKRELRVARRYRVERTGLVMKLYRFFLVFILLLCPPWVLGKPAASTADAEELAPQLENLKKDVLALNRDLLILEEELLYPSSTQVVVFLSLDVGTWFDLDAVKLKIDDKLVASELYTTRQRNSLSRGGIQRLYIGNLKKGAHEISAFFTGKGPQGRNYKRAASITIEKGHSASMLELKVEDDSASEQPAFSIVEWEI